MLLLKSLMIVNLLFAFSIKSTQQSNDYEFMIGGSNKQFSFAVEKERENGQIYYYQEIRYRTTVLQKRLLSFYLLNNQEDNINLIELNIGDKFNEYIIYGFGIVRNNFANIEGTVYINLVYKSIASYKYSLLQNGFIHNLNLQWRYMLSEKLALIPRGTYINTNDNESFQAKLLLEWRLQ